MSGYLQLALAAALPAVTALFIFILNKRGKFRTDTLPNQIVIGILFGGIAVLGTEFGVPINGAQMNCRDAAVLIPGLMFGGPAGIIAGIIGGVERWIAVAWGVGTYTRVACSVSTVLAGFFAALIRRFMFENKKPTWGMAFSAGISMEVFHLTMVFLTNINDASNAIQVVKVCSAPMIISNGLSVMAASVLISRAAHEKQVTYLGKRQSETPIFLTLQRGMLVVVFLCMLISNLLVYNLQKGVSDVNTRELMQNELSEIREELAAEIDSYMLELCNLVKSDLEINHMELRMIALKYDLREINLVDREGIITDSNQEELIGYDMASDTQSAEFMCLLEGTSSYVQAFQATSFNQNIVRKYAGIATEDGFLQVGYDTEGLTKQIGDTIRDIVAYRRIGVDGILLIMDEEDQVISATDNAQQEGIDADSLDVISDEIDEQPGILSMQGTTCYYMSQTLGTYQLYALYPVEEAIIQRDISVYLTIFLLILMFVALYIVIYIMVKQVVVKQITEMTLSLSSISQGNLDEVVDIRSSEEFASLSSDINRTVDTLKRYIDEAAARIDAELELCSTIQSAVLPATDLTGPNRNCFDIAAKMDPAKEVGGDFYDFYFTQEHLLHLTIADVSGKGIPAAMFMMQAKSVLRNMTEQGHAVEQVMMESNDILSRGNDAEMFVTAWHSCLNLKTGLLRFTNAGHNPPMCYRQGEGFKAVSQKPGMVLGVMAGLPYRYVELQLQPGDILLLYTDGVVEANNAAGELYGEERLLQVLNAQEYSSMDQLLKEVRADVDRFVGEADQFDDLTMVAVRYLGPNGGK